MVDVQQSAGYLEINLSALKRNWCSLADRAHPATCSAVIKANGYGLGLEEVMGALLKAGCHTFFVAHLSEAKRARTMCDQSTIYVLNGLMPETASFYADVNVRPVIGSVDEWREWQGYIASCQNGVHPLAALHVDTGMNRLGMSIEQAREISANTTHHNSVFSLIMSHLRSAEDWQDPMTNQQIHDFEIVRALFPDVPASLSNSSGIFRDEKPFYDMVRAGYALYGGNPTPYLPTPYLPTPHLPTPHLPTPHLPTPHLQNPMQPVITLKARIIQVRDVAEGECVGYNGTWRTLKNSRIAVVNVGYADGYPRAASCNNHQRDHKLPCGYAIVGGVKCPFAGRVSMDLLTIDVSDVPQDVIKQGALKRGEWVTLIGDGLPLDEVAHNAGTIGYELLTQLGHRYTRHYSGDEQTLEPQANSVGI